ncbi:hypothetical protein PTH_0421 [Pelotomaculum thermopropionicum SI]|uniref:DUF1659 domain-containing protein n=1 Tax=Pelotomaculum thermopropionicum (strain DSM 13744 / JCM 10971 / SI) TaxID=370438 RepID=A5D575_PELTS|nr:hypothetical protein PTH_0421 [Pelotomaculum thermopropionicum SI]
MNRVPVNKIPAGSVLRLELRVGVDQSGNPVYRNRSFSNVKPGASDQDLFDVAGALAALLEYPLNSVSRIDSAHLVQA